MCAYDVPDPTTTTQPYCCLHLLSSVLMLSLRKRFINSLLYQEMVEARVLQPFLEEQNEGALSQESTGTPQRFPSLPCVRD